MRNGPAPEHIASIQIPAGKMNAKSQYPLGLYLSFIYFPVSQVPYGGYSRKHMCGWIKRVCIGRVGYMVQLDIPR